MPDRHIATPYNPDNWLAAARLAFKLNGGVQQRPKGRPVPSSGYLYFIGSDDGPIKIGASTNPQRRLSDLKYKFGGNLRILCAVPGMADEERNMHFGFQGFRLHGEWFEPHPIILEVIDILNSPDFDPAGLNPANGLQCGVQTCARLTAKES